MLLGGFVVTLFPTTPGRLDVVRLGRILNRDASLLPSEVVDRRPERRRGGFGFNRGR